jgi:hypothetical protein
LKSRVGGQRGSPTWLREPPLRGRRHAARCVDGRCPAHMPGLATGSRSRAIGGPVPSSRGRLGSFAEEYGVQNDRDYVAFKAPTVSAGRNPRRPPRRACNAALRSDTAILLGLPGPSGRHDSSSSSLKASGGPRRGRRRGAASGLTGTRSPDSAGLPASAKLREGVPAPGAHAAGDGVIAYGGRADIARALQPAPAGIPVSFPIAGPSVVSFPVRPILGFVRSAVVLDGGARQ